MIHSVLLVKPNENRNENMKLNFDSLPPHERTLQYLVASITETPYVDDSSTHEKSTTVRFNYNNYSKVKAIANLSGNSLSSVVNDLVQVAHASVIANLSDEEIDRMNGEILAVHQQLIDELNSGGE